MGLDRRYWSIIKNRAIDRLRLNGYSQTVGVAISVLLYDTNNKVLLASGTTVPTDATSGYAKGCIFIDTNVSTGLQGLYVNVGTSTSCVFAPMSPVSPSFDGYTNPVRSAIVDLTSANVKALRATPITLVAAPAAGYFLEFIRADLYLDYSTNVFTESDDNLAVKYTNGSGVAVSQTIETTGFIDQSVDTYTCGLPKIDAIVVPAGIAAQALVLHNTGDGEIAGNASNLSALQVRTQYKLWPILD